MGRKTPRRGILKFFTHDYPAIFRETFRDTFAAFVIFLAAAFAGALMGMADTSFSRHFLGPQMIDTIEHHKMWTDSIVTVKATASSFILTNNISVCFAIFAFGITAGIGTIYMLVLNGLMIGVIGVACWREGMSLPLWSFVVAHGSLELPAIFIAGGAGLGIARGLLFPGFLPRKESLARAGSRSVKLILGTIPMLLVAGFVEGFVSPTEIPKPVKFILGAGLFTLLVLYLLHKPTEKPQTKTAESVTLKTAPAAQLR
jgi:uncharacterized membrane protein SpoIIM required for sporulation